MRFLSRSLWYRILVLGMLFIWILSLQLMLMGWICLIIWISELRLINGCFEDGLWVGTVCVYFRENRRVVGTISIREALLLKESHYFMEIIKMD